MRRNQRRTKVVTMQGVMELWSVRLPDGRRAELQAKNRKKAAEQAAMIWNIPTDWLLSNARIARA